MFCVRCPACDQIIELDTETVDELFRVAGCDNCDSVFDYDEQAMIRPYVPVDRPQVEIE